MSSRTQSVSVTASTSATITVQELGRAIIQHVVVTYFERDFDDAGCDWFVSRNDPAKVYIGDRDRVACENPTVGALAVAAQILMFGAAIYIEDYVDGRRRTP